LRGWGGGDTKKNGAFKGLTKNLQEKKLGGQAERLS